MHNVQCTIYNVECRLGVRLEAGKDMGVMEKWSDGGMEFWSDGVKGKTQFRIEI